MATPPRRDVKDAPIPNQVKDAEKIKENLKSDNNISQLMQEGQKLLERTNRPNIITWAEFQPFVPLFNMDKERYHEERPSGPYHLEMNQLYNRYIRNLGINLYEPTIVIYSREDPREVFFLDRRYTRIRSDYTDGKSTRDTIPGAISRVANTTRDQMILEASVKDLVMANNTPEQKAFFAQIKMASAVVNKNFVERNLPSDKREEILGTTPQSSTDSNKPQDAGGGMLLDDDDD